MKPAGYIRAISRHMSMRAGPRRGASFAGSQRWRRVIGGRSIRASVDKERALAIFTREFVRELLRGDEEPESITPSFIAGPPDGPTMATPQFDFDEEPVSEAELDAALGDEGDEVIARARRRATILAQRQAERLWPEDLPMGGLGPPEDLP
jgi:hypothetical protein